MASNFKISIHRNSDNLHLKLVGDFDGTSAHQLLDALIANSNTASNVFIHTSCLRDIHPFGESVFRKNLGRFKRESVQLVFTGENSHRLAPEGAKLF